MNEVLNFVNPLVHPTDQLPGAQVPNRCHRCQKYLQRPKYQTDIKNMARAKTLAVSMFLEEALARPAGLEPATSGLGIRYSIQLSYGR